MKAQSSLRMPTQLAHRRGADEGSGQTLTESFACMLL